MAKLTERLPFFILSLLVLSFSLSACGNSDADTSELGDSVQDETSRGEVENTDTLFTSTVGRYSVQFSGGKSIVEQAVPIQTELGSINMNMVLADRGDYAMMAAYSDYPDEISGLRKDREILDSARGGAVRNVNGTLVSERDYEFQGHPAKEFYVKGEEQGKSIYVRCNVILVKARLYQVLYLSVNEDDLDGEIANNYIKSFKIDEEAADEGGKEEEAGK